MLLFLLWLMASLPAAANEDPAQTGKTVTAGGASFYIGPKCYGAIQMPGRGPMGPAVEDALNAAAEALRGCLQKLSLTYRDKIAQQLSKQTNINCADASNSSGYTCALTVKLADPPVINLFPKSVQADNPCDTPPKLIIHEILHAADLPFVQGHHDTYAATENDPIYGTAALCWGDQKDIERMPYSQCTASLDDHDQIAKICGSKRYPAFLKAMSAAQPEFEEQVCKASYEGMKVCSPDEYREVVGRTFDAVFPQKAKELDFTAAEGSDLRALYIQNSPDGVDPSHPEKYTPSR